MKTLTEARRILQEEQKKARGAYVRGVYVDAFDLIDVLEGYEPEQLEAATNKKDLKKLMLCGAESTKEASYGACFLIYDKDIAERLCNPSELKKTKHGQRRPNRNEEWLDVQARALNAAIWIVSRILLEE